ncbi:MAG TPA: hypothetical protein VF066_05665, partial [Thermoleophilaceae bacterium]
MIKFARISLIVTAFLALPAVATAADLTGPTLADAPATAPACKPSRNTFCGPAQTPKLDAAVAGYAATLSSNKTRRGLGLPTLRQLFGKAGARAQALADGRLTGPAPKTARAAAAGGLGTVATVGHVSVEATPAPGLGAGVDEITYTDQIKGPGGKQMRSIRFNVTADACPVAASGAENVGRDMGHMLVAEHIVTVQRSGRLELTTDFTIDTTNTQNIWGTVKGNSDLATIDSNLPAYVRIRRVRTARDLRTGKRYREKPVELDYEMNEISPLWMFGDAFDKFIDKYANANDDNPADAVVSDRLLNEDAFEAAARTFMTAVEAKTRSIFEAAETQWKTPNRCVDMK